MQINKKIITASFLLVTLLFNNTIFCMYTGRNVINGIQSSIGLKTTAGLTIAATLLSAYLINKNNKAQQLKDYQAKESKYIKQNIKVTPSTIFVFDINDVIIKADFNKIWNIINKQILSKYKLKLGSAFIRPYLYYIVFTEISKGGVPEQILNRIATTYPQFTDITYHGLELANAQSQVPGMFELIEKLKKEGHDLLLLSNVGEDRFLNKDSSIGMLNKEFPIFNNFDLTASLLTTKNDNYLKKPKTAFYEKFLDKFIKKYGKDRIKDIIFIDDRMKNVIAARSAGIPSVWFVSSDDLKEKLNI
jgi:FMN phosphatase YigB (HAD superfamily)